MGSLFYFIRILCSFVLYVGVSLLESESRKAFIYYLIFPLQKQELFPHCNDLLCQKNEMCHPLKAIKCINRRGLFVTSALFIFVQKLNLR